MYAGPTESKTATPSPMSYAFKANDFGNDYRREADGRHDVVANGVPADIKSASINYNAKHAKAAIRNRHGAVRAFEFAERKMVVLEATNRVQQKYSTESLRHFSDENKANSTRQ